MNRAKMILDIEEAWLVPILDSNFPKNKAAAEEASCSNFDTSRSTEKELVRPYLLTGGETSDELKRLRINDIRIPKHNSKAELGTNLLIKQNIIGLAHLAINSAQENDRLENRVSDLKFQNQEFLQVIQRMEIKYELELIDQGVKSLFRYL